MEFQGDAAGRGTATGRRRSAGAGKVATGRAPAGCDGAKVSAGLSAGAEGRRIAEIAVVVSLGSRAVSSSGEEVMVRTEPEPGPPGGVGGIGRGARFRVGAPTVPVEVVPDFAARWFASHAGSGFLGGPAEASVPAGVSALAAAAGVPLPFAAGRCIVEAGSAITCQSSRSSSLGGHTSAGAVLSVETGAPATSVAFIGTTSPTLAVIGARFAAGSAGVLTAGMAEAGGVTR